MALREGLRAWARAPVKIGFGTAVTLGFLVVAYALAIQVSPSLWATLSIWAIVAHLALGGWGFFCAEHVGDGPASWSALFAGFRRPVTVTAAGLVAVAFALVPPILAGYVTVVLGGPDWLARMFLVLVACLCAPAGSFISLETISGATLPGVITNGMARAIRHWPALGMLALLTAGLAVAGLLPGLLLERHALLQIGALLPAGIAEFDLAVVRFLALLGGIASMSAAGCIWAAAWRGSHETPQSHQL